MQILLLNELQNQKTCLREHAATRAQVRSCAMHKIPHYCQFEFFMIELWRLIMGILRIRTNIFSYDAAKQVSPTTLFGKLGCLYFFSTVIGDPSILTV